MSNQPSEVKVDLYNGLFRATFVFAALSKLIIILCLFLTIVFLIAKAVNSEIMLEGFKHYNIEIKHLIFAAIFFFAFMIINKRLTLFFKKIYDRALDQSINYYKKSLSKRKR